MPVSYADLCDAFFFVNAGGIGENEAFFDTRSGQIYWHSEFNDVKDELPDDIEDERYIAIPHGKELGLGKPLALEFARQVLPHRYDEVRQIFSRRGAHGRFKAFLVRVRALQRWYEFSSAAQEAALREWCQQNSIELTD
ncbi:MAG TPA: hypothetical protein VLX85_01520 [Stellaceae bacterium]|nr:hypothetical protein [Stellaceae bacterium]